MFFFFNDTATTEIYTLSLHDALPILAIHRVYNGWFFVGRPTLEELRHDLREIMQTRSDYRYEAYNTSPVKSIRIPQQEWSDGAPPVGASGLPVEDRKSVV